MQVTKKVNNDSSRLSRISVVCVIWSSFFAGGPLVQAQDLPQQATTTGTVTSSSRNTLVVKTEDGQYRLFVFDRNTTKPATLAAGSEVQVVSSPTDDPGVRLALVVATVQGNAPPSTRTPEQPSAVPAPIRDTERAIQREAKRFHFGFQGGFALDPELIDIGVHAQFGPFFSRNLFVRPTAEFDYGETTRLFGLNFDILYNMPFTAGARRYVYFGAGPGFNFVEQSVKGQGVSFSNFHYDSALNVFLGIRYRSGLFTELRTSVYATPAPVFRLTVGYTF